MQIYKIYSIFASSNTILCNKTQDKARSRIADHIASEEYRNALAIFEVGSHRESLVRPEEVPRRKEH